MKYIEKKMNPLCNNPLCEKGKLLNKNNYIKQNMTKLILKLIIVYLLYFIYCTYANLYRKYLSCFWFFFNF